MSDALANPQILYALVDESYENYIFGIYASMQDVEQARDAIRRAQYLDKDERDSYRIVKLFLKHGLDVFYQPKHLGPIQRLLEQQP